MKLPLCTFLILITFAVVPAFSQQKKTAPTQRKPGAEAKAPEVGQTAIVLDETLSVLRDKPRLFAEPVQRMRRGRKVQIQAVTAADGVKFYRVTAPPGNFGWVQADAVFGKFRPADEERLAKLVQASDAFDKIELAVEFFSLYPDSKYRPALLLLCGDVLEEVAAKLSKDASSRLSRTEMAATGAPLHSYFLNFVSLDRYRKLGIVFQFNSSTRQFHYDGACWKEIVARFNSTPEAAEASKRLDNLKLKMEKPVGN